MIAIFNIPAFNWSSVENSQ